MAGHGRSGAAGREYLIDDSLAIGQTTARDDGVRALRGKKLGDGGANAAACSANHGNLAGEIK
jgi:hypothetical protein